MKEVNERCFAITTFANQFVLAVFSEVAKLYHSHCFALLCRKARLHRDALSAKHLISSQAAVHCPESVQPLALPCQSTGNGLHLHYICQSSRESLWFSMARSRCEMCQVLSFRDGDATC